VARRNQAYFQDLLEVPEGYTSFYLQAISSFQSITNEEAKLYIQNIRVIVERDPEGTYSRGGRARSRLRGRGFSRGCGVMIPARPC